MKKFLRGHYLILGIIAGVILGGIVGSFYPETGVRVGFLGKLFINALKMIVLPLILVSITLSIMKVERLGSLGLRTFVYFISTTAIAVILGIVLVNLIHPGVGGAVLTGEIPEIIKGKENMSIVEVLLLEFVSPNLFESAVKFDILPLIVASILFGAAFAALGRENKPVVELFTLLDKAVMKIVHWIMIFTPLGIFGLIAERIGLAGGGSQVIALAAELGRYFLCVVLGLFIHGVIILPMILFLFSGRNPLEYVSHLGRALLTAFSTASSSATLPLTMEGVIDEAGVSPKVARFVLPLGATVNMDGTALYEAVAAIFIAQSYGIELGIPQMVVVFFTATLASIGAAGIPEAGLVTMVLVLKSVGLPIEGIGLILAIDWLLDRFRTTINVWGDCVGAAVIDKYESEGQGKV
ncbi:MAG: sodium:dicarboxylate symporter [Candidatus Dadabacteria bacterium RIFCSPHIGHO2_12_FULL_53_21]|nr:MAG: sodium:dicarboxylate symporter [Candidatus Dadabacteria bacterium RIFCSPHIGHO2_12_FULL_53_21]